ncbi:MAG: hypothetical protein IJ081_05595 [Prevotella sp.]|nr:hypothetical protein [Prevotella sp.]
MNKYGFSIDDGHYKLPNEQMAKLAKELQDNNPMHDINKHYNDEINLLSAMMDEMKKQSIDTDKKHAQTMAKANWQIFWAIAAVVIAAIALILNLFPEIGMNIRNSLHI